MLGKSPLAQVFINSSCYCPFSERPTLKQKKNKQISRLRRNLKEIGIIFYLQPLLLFRQRDGQALEILLAVRTMRETKHKAGVRHIWWLPSDFESAQNGKN